MKTIPLIHVCHVTFGLDVGGLERLLVEFARHADRRQFRLTFVSLGSRGQLADEIQACGWPVYALEQPEGLRPGLIFRLARLFASQSVDVVHCHEPRALFYGGPAARLVAVRRVIHTQHGRLTWATRRQVRVFSHLCRLTSSVVAVSHDCAEELASLGVPRLRLHTIHNGIDLARFRFVGPSASGPVVAVGRLSAEKDHANLIRATKIAIGKDPTLSVSIAGDGPCRQQLQALVSELHLQDRVQFLGAVNEIAALLATASEFVLPSRTEGISLTLLEAMARGLPVVATHVGGTPEVLAEPGMGLMVPPSDPIKLAESILALRQDVHRARRMGCEARLRVEQHFDVRRMVAAYESHYSADSFRERSSLNGSVTESDRQASAGASSLRAGPNLNRSNEIAGQ